MKNHIAFKFIAIALCAASLLGAVGSIVCVAGLTESDLYNNTVDQLKEDRAQLNALGYAESLAWAYASSELGGCPEAMVEDSTDLSWLDSMYSNYGYTITDAEGNIVSSYNADLTGNLATYTAAKSGQYMHLVSTQAEADAAAQSIEDRIAAYTDNVFTDIDGESVPEEGISIEQVMLLDAGGNMIYEANCDAIGNATSVYTLADGSSHGWHQDSHRVGFLFYNQNGQMVYQSFLTEDPADSGMEFPPTEVYAVLFINYDEDFVFNAHDPNGLGTASNQDRSLHFVSNILLEAPAEETQPVTEATVETVPPETATEETIVETAAEETTEETFAEEATEATTAEEETEETVPSSASAIPQETTPAAEPIINGKPLSEYQVNTTQYWDSDTQQWMTAKYVYVPMPELTVSVFVDLDSSRYNTSYTLLALIRQFRDYLIPTAAACLLLFAILAVYLCTAAGRSPKSGDVKAGGLNRIPLDLYLFGAGIGAALCIVYGAAALQYLLEQNLMVACAAAIGLFFLASLFFVGFCFAFAAQMKTPDGFWWRNTLCGHGIRLFERFGVWFAEYMKVKGFPALVQLAKKLWQWIVLLFAALDNGLHWLAKKVTVGFRWLSGKINRFLSLLPLTWQWLLGGCLLIFIAAVFINDYVSPNVGLLAFLVCLAIVLYASHCFGVLLESTKKMSKGDLDTKVEDKFMAGSFKEFAGDLNDLAGVAVVAAQKQLRSERMKTELITNVSHDIKTPLTSIINYVDLLQKPHSEEEEQQYLEVLDRQSQRLKKLIDDLMDMSKANTGNMSVDITTVDAVESVNQALGEFADKLDRAQLIPVFRHDDALVHMQADGRLVWRVLSNLLSNAVKYAMPGTRLYIDLTTAEGKVILSLKNISREELNIDADELMERFVRGDDSRNTEGSGLGLNIAKSLMELQKGQMQLLVDGDLFKVTLIFPGA